MNIIRIMLNSYNHIMSPSTIRSQETLTISKHAIIALVLSTHEVKELQEFAYGSRQSIFIKC